MAILNFYNLIQENTSTMSYPTITRGEFSQLDDYDLKHQYDNLIEGMKTFTEESKIKYPEAWAHRLAKQKELETEMTKRGFKFLERSN